MPRLAPAATALRTPAAGVATYPRLVGEVGPGRVRFATVMRPGGPLQDVATRALDDRDGLPGAAAAYLRAAAGACPRAAAIAVPAPVTGDEVRLPGGGAPLSQAALRRALGLERLRVVNDFEALALALPAMPAHELRPVGGGQAVPGAALALIGPGHGLGVSGLLTAAGDGPLVPVAGEGGHATLASHEPDEADVLARLRLCFGHVSAERALSAAGLSAMHDAVRALSGAAPGPSLDAEAVVARGLSGRDAHCARALSMFCALLGQVAGDLALTLGARGGVYVAGDLVPRLGAWFDRSAFRRRFEDKGRFRDYLRAIPTCVVAAGPAATLRGACRALDLAA